VGMVRRPGGRTSSIELLLLSKGRRGSEQLVVGRFRVSNRCIIIISSRSAGSMDEYGSRRNGRSGDVLDLGASMTCQWDWGQRYSCWLKRCSWTKGMGLYCGFALCRWTRLS